MPEETQLTMDPSTPPKGEPSSSSEPAPFKITIIFSAEHFSEPWTFNHPPLLDEILTECEQTWPQYDWEKTKAIPITTGHTKPPKGFKSLLKTPDDESLDLTPLNNLSLKLMAPKISDLTSLKAASSEAAARRAARAQHRNTARIRAARINARPPGGPPRISGLSYSSQSADTQYTFQTLRPLPYLPNPQRSLSFLERLRDDPGIRATMKKHQFTVGLLTEMDPGQYTASDHQGTTRILGLNRNRGQVIELRLRTDAYDGYRDYKTIRKTLCHELAHNIHGDHDRQFWDLTHQIEREVERADYLGRGGRSVGGEEYAPARGEGDNDYGEEDGEVVDHGGWVGGTFVLGGGGNGGGSGNAGRQQEAGLSMRDILARAAEQRLRNLDKGNEKDGGNEKDSSERGGPAA